MKAVDICMKAAELVGGPRDRTHGSKVRNHANIATLWDAYLQNRNDKEAPINALDVANMMELLKIARRQSGAYNPDDYLDGCGYSACAGEIAEAFYGEHS